MTDTPPTKLGILGGGQLARMLAEAAMAKSTPVAVLLGSTEEPAALPGVELIVGSLNDEEAITQLFASCDVVTLENEFVDLDALRGAANKHPGVAVRPGLKGVAVAQDKLSQKRLFETLEIPSAPFDTISRDGVLSTELERICDAFANGFVLKWSRFGYDGKGNFVCARPAELDTEQATAFCNSAWERGGEVYAEAFVDFACEVAMVSGRRDDGEQVFFPLVVSRQERNVCREVFGPAHLFDVNPNLEAQAIEAHRQVGRELDMTGVFAIEFFVTSDGELLANEMAPRVHNTGHYTLWSGETSQFDVHVQAVLGQEISAPEVRDVAVMRNILGPWSLASPIECQRPQVQAPAGGSLYWYEKKTAKAGRKLGHITGRAGSPKGARALLASFEEFETEYWKRATKATKS